MVILKDETLEVDGRVIEVGVVIDEMRVVKKVRLHADNDGGDDVGLNIMYGLLTRRGWLMVWALLIKRGC